MRNWIDIISEAQKESETKKDSLLSDFETDLSERAPHSKKGERFIKNHKSEFKERYGDKWKQILYATAWKLFGE